MAKKNEVIKDIQNAELEEAIKEMKEYQTIMEQAEQKVKEIKAKVRNFMEENGETYVAIGQYKCKISEVTTTKFDKKYIQEKAPELFKEASYAETGTRFTIN